MELDIIQSWQCPHCASPVRYITDGVIHDREESVVCHVVPSLHRDSITTAATTTTATIQGRLLFQYHQRIFHLAVPMTTKQASGASLTTSRCWRWCWDVFVIGMIQWFPLAGFVSRVPWKQQDQSIGSSSSAAAASANRLSINTTCGWGGRRNTTSTNSTAQGRIAEVLGLDPHTMTILYQGKMLYPLKTLTRATSGDSQNTIHPSTIGTRRNNSTIDSYPQTAEELSQLLMELSQTTWEQSIASSSSPSSQRGGQRQQQYRPPAVLVVLGCPVTYTNNNHVPLIQYWIVTTLRWIHRQSSTLLQMLWNAWTRRNTFLRRD